jgi:hypothetical protein
VSVRRLSARFFRFVELDAEIGHAILQIRASALNGLIIGLASATTQPSTHTNDCVRESLQA